MSRGTFPSAAEEELQDTMSLDEYLIKNKEATFMLKVASDSMAKAGILEGDMVLVERGKKPRPGDIVIVRFEGEDYKLEYFGSSKKAHVVEAVVTAVIRKY
jgi:SOS-response transcriptional repressor LexA